MGSREEQLVSWGHVTSLMSFSSTHRTQRSIREAQPHRDVQEQDKYAHACTQTHMPATNSPWPSGPECRWFLEHVLPLKQPPGCQSPQSRNLWSVERYSVTKLYEQPSIGHFVLSLLEKGCDICIHLYCLLLWTYQGIFHVIKREAQFRFLNLIPASC